MGTATHEKTSDVTQLLRAFGHGQPSESQELLPLVYDELRKLAAARLNEERPGNTLQPTALVHEAYLRLVNSKADQPWNNRGHFFSAAAEAMRRILIESARRKQTEKRGGSRERLPLDEAEVAAAERSDDVLALDEALTYLEKIDRPAAELMKLRYFAGMTVREAADVVGIPPRTADAVLAYAKAWLRDRIQGTSS